VRVFAACRPLWKRAAGVIPKRRPAAPTLAVAQGWSVPRTRPYDADGNLINDGVWTYTWDGESRLTQMQPTSLAVSSGAPNHLLVFAYDYLGRRVQ
jgi:hypothetical protein